MSYQVFARKYRPQTFDEVVGQEHITQTLKNAISQSRLAHAYLFVGPRGIGKTSTARILAKALNCVEGPTPIPCNQCDSCKEITAGNNLDVLEIDGASNNGVEQVRELRENVLFAPVRGKFRIYIIDEVHMLTAAAFNALLKTLEEPPPHAKFIFATTEPQRVLPTILSRCQRFDLRRIPSGLIAQHLLFIAKYEGLQLTEAAARAVAKGADGGLRDAESMLDQLVAFCGSEIDEPDVMTVFGFTAVETVSNIAQAMLERDTSRALELLHNEADAGKDLMKLLSDLITHLRNLLICQVDPKNLQDEFSPELRQALEAQAGLAGSDRVLSLIDQFAATEGRMRWAPNKRLHFEIAIIRAVQSIAEATLDEVIDALNAIREGKPAPVRPVPRAATPPLQLKPSATLKREFAKPAAIQPPPRPAPASLPTPPPVAQPAAPVAEPPSAFRQPEPASEQYRVEPMPARQPEPLSQPREPEPLSRREPEPVAMPDSIVVPEPEAGPAPQFEPESEPAGPVSGQSLWRDLVKNARATVGHARASWLQTGAFHSLEGDTFTVAFKPSDRMALETVLRESNRVEFEAILRRLSGQNIKFAAISREGVTADPIGEDAGQPEKQAEDPMAELKNDPKIRKALDAFKANIIEAEAPR